MTLSDSDNPFEATYAVEMHCDGCVQDIKSCLASIPGISLDFHVPEKLASGSERNCCTIGDHFYVTEVWT